MGAASDDLLDAGENGMDRRRRERQEADAKSKLSFDRSGAIRVRQQVKETTADHRRKGVVS